MKLTNNEFLKHLGTELKIARIRRDLTQAEVGKLCGMITETIGAMEAGQKDSHILSYKRVADALDIDFKTLLP